MKEKQALIKQGREVIKDGNKKTERGKGGENECPAGEEERRRGGKQKGLCSPRKSEGMEGVSQRQNRGGSKSSCGHRGREMAAMNK